MIKQKEFIQLLRIVFYNVLRCVQGLWIMHIMPFNIEICIGNIDFIRLLNSFVWLWCIKSDKTVNTHYHYIDAFTFLASLNSHQIYWRCKLTINKPNCMYLEWAWKMNKTLGLRFCVKQRLNGDITCRKKNFFNFLVKIHSQMKHE